MGEDNDDDISVVGRAAPASSAPTRPWRRPRGQRGRRRPGPGGCRDEDENVGIGIGIGRKEYILLAVLDQKKYSAPSDSKTVHHISLYQLDVEDVARREPQVGAVKVYRSSDSGSMLRLVDEGGGYDPMDGF